jgi:hypothetical protein
MSDLPPSEGEKPPDDGQVPGDRAVITSLEVANHWVAVYSDLVALTEEVMARARNGMPPEFQAAELDMLQTFVDSLADRLALWRMHRGSLLLDE